MKKKWAIVLAALLVVGLATTWGYQHFVQQDELVLDAQNQASLPAEFRIDRDLHILGSAQFSQLQLINVLHMVNRPLVIIDLRQETHAFIDGDAISWMTGDPNALMPIAVSATVEHDQINRGDVMGLTPVYEVSVNNQGQFHNTAEVPLPMDQIATENQLAKTLGIPYFHFPVPYRHIPTAKIVDSFIKKVGTLPQNTWLYFHCRDGIKRTNLFMSMYDMLLNAKDTDFDTILHRDYIRTNREVTDPYDAAQIDFLKQFYNYSRDANSSKQLTWSTWLKKSYDAKTSSKNKAALAQER